MIRLVAQLLLEPGELRERLLKVSVLEGHGHLVRERSQRHGLQLKLERAGVEPGQIEEVGGELLQAVHLLATLRCDEAL